MNIGLNSVALLEKFPFSLSRSLSTLMSGVHPSFEMKVYGISHSELECVRKGVPRYRAEKIAHAGLLLVIDTNPEELICSIDSDLAKKLILLESYESQLLQVDMLLHALSQLESVDAQRQIRKGVGRNDEKF